MKLMPVVAMVALVAAVAGAAAIWWPAGKTTGQAAVPAGMPEFIVPDPAKPAPETVFKNGAGADITLASLKGDILVVNLWATWCAPCIEELPSLARLADATKDDGIKVVAVSVDRAESSVIRNFLDVNQARGLEAFHDAGMALARDFGVRGLPTTIIIDAQGEVRGMFVGPADWAAPATIDFVRSFRPAG